GPAKLPSWPWHRPSGMRFFRPRASVCGRCHGSGWYGSLRGLSPFRDALSGRRQGGSPGARAASLFCFVDEFAVNIWLLLIPVFPETLPKHDETEQLRPGIGKETLPTFLRAPERSIVALFEPELVPHLAQHDQAWVVGVAGGNQARCYLGIHRWPLSAS